MFGLARVSKEYGNAEPERPDGSRQRRRAGIHQSNRDRVFAKSTRVRCWFQRTGNFHEKVPHEIWPEVKAELAMIRDAASYGQGKQLVRDSIARHKPSHPSLIKAFEDDLDALLNHLRLPINHRKSVRTVNLQDADSRRGEDEPR